MVFFHRLLTLEVLMNTLKRLPESNVGSDNDDSRVPAVANILYIAAEFILQSHLIPNMVNDPDVHNKVRTHTCLKVQSCCYYHKKNQLKISHIQRHEINTT